MVGAGVLQECLEDARVTAVLAISRAPSGVTHPKLRERLHHDFFDFSALGAELTGVDACFFCLGVSSAGLDEARYRRLTYDLTMAAATLLADLNPGMTFCYVSGEGTDSTEQGRVMWARVKGRTENHLLGLPLSAYMFRPGFIRPLAGVRSKTAVYRLAYAVIGPLYPLLKRIAPRHVTTSENLARAMIAVAAGGSPKRLLENPDINALA
jgi:uncharacterized protein YbjT (DUF2867 family)